MRPAIWSFSKSRIAAAGIRRRSPRRCRWWRRRFEGGPGPYAVQAAIAALHCRAARPEDTDWPQILRLYDLLERLQPSPIVSLNRAVAVAMVQGLRPALALIDALARRGDLDDYHLLHSARADLLRRLGSARKPREAYRRALALVTNDSERRFLERRLREVRGAEHEIVYFSGDYSSTRGDGSNFRMGALGSGLDAMARSQPGRRDSL